MNAIDILKRDHRKTEALFAKYARATAPERKRELANEIREELSVHAAIEELELYPVAEETLPDGKAEADEALDEHQTVKETLAALEKLEATDPEFDRKMKSLEEDVEHHVKDEEERTFPKLEERLGAERLAEIGERLESARKTAPTHPHPHAPNRPPANRVAGAAAAAIDKVRDSITGKGS